jgi:intracellular multiplication protein IcmO
MSIRESGFYRGVKESQIAKRQKTFRDVRTLGEKIYDFINSNEFVSFILFMLTATAITFPFLLLPNLIMSIGFYMIRMHSIKKQMLVGRLPKETGLKDLSDPIPDTDDKKHFTAGGIFLVGKDRETKQEFWLADKDILTHMLIFGTTGAGKALPLDEKVLTPNGFVDMGSLAVGDSVISIDGKPTTVTGVFPQGKEQVYTLTFEDGREVEASGEHLWEVHHKHWNGKYEKGVSRVGMAKPRVLTTLEIEAILQKNKGAFYLPLTSAFQVDDSVLPLEPYLLGALLGDGNFKDKNFRFSNTDKDIINKVKTLVELYGSTLKQYENQKNDHDFHIVEKKSQSGRLSDGSYHKSELREIIRNLGLWGLSANEKIIPDAYRPEKISVKQRLELIQGLLDTDGTVGKNGSVYFYTTSLKLAKQVQELIWSIGGLAKISEKQTFYQDSNGNKKSGLKSYSVNIRYQSPKELFYCSRKLEKIPENYQYKNSLKLRIKSVKKSGIKETQCIKVAHDSSLFLTRNYVVTHNTETLVSLTYNAIALGSGLFYTDPKAAPKLAFQIFAMSRFMGREHDFLVVNYSVGSRSPYKLNPKRVTNTMNPFSMGSAEMLSEVLNALLPLSDGENAVFSNNAQTMVKSLMYGLVEKRNKKELPLSVKTIREYMSLDKYIELATDTGLSKDAQEAMQAYLSGIGWREGTSGQKLQDVARQHGFSLSYFALPLASLADTYGNIYLNARGEVDSYDVIKYRRIAVILLPALEMSPGQLKNVGQITLSSVRNACAIGLGDRLEGHKVDVIDALPTNSPVPGVNLPFLTVTDEYAAIPTPGYAEVLTQGRGLGIAAIVASQDYAGIKGADEKGAKQIVANTKVKLIMAMDDPEDTWDLVQKLSGEVEVSVSSGYDAKNSTLGNFQDGAGASLEKRARVDIMDLQSQIEGEFHGFFKGKLIRGQTFYANPNIDNIILSINEKIGIDDIDKTIIDRNYGEIRKLTESFAHLVESGGISQERAKEMLELNERQKRLIKGLKQGFEDKNLRDFKTRTITAVMLAKQYASNAQNGIQSLISIKKKKIEEQESANQPQVDKEGATRPQAEKGFGEKKILKTEDGAINETMFDEDLPFGGMFPIGNDDDDDEIEYEDHEVTQTEKIQLEFTESVVKGFNASIDPVEKQSLKRDARIIEKAINPENYNPNRVNEEIDKALIQVKYEEPVPKKTKPTKQVCDAVVKIIELVETKTQNDEQ